MKNYLHQVLTDLPHIVVIQSDYLTNMFIEQ